jgi:hypothetical protein
MSSNNAHEPCEKNKSGLPFGPLGKFGRIINTAIVNDNILADYLSDSRQTLA